MQQNGLQIRLIEKRKEKFMKLRSIMIAMVASLTLVAAASARAGMKKDVKKTVFIKTEKFKNVAVAGSFSIHYIQGKTTSVKVRGRQKDLDLIKVENKGETLSFSFKKSKNNNWFSSSFHVDDIDVYITSPNIRKISIAGSGEFEAKGHVDTDEMTIKVSGSGEVDLKNLICNKITIDIAGSGEVDIDRITTAEARMNIAGSGSIDMENANIGYAKSEIAGSGTIELNGNIKSHNEKVAGSGEVKINR